MICCECGDFKTHFFFFFFFPLTSTAREWFFHYDSVVFNFSKRFENRSTSDSRVILALNANNRVTYECSRIEHLNAKWGTLNENIEPFVFAPIFLELKWKIKDFFFAHKGLMSLKSLFKCAPITAHLRVASVTSPRHACVIIIREK